MAQAGEAGTQEGLMGLRSALVTALAIAVLVAFVTPIGLYADDLFYGAWGGYYGQTGKFTSAVLARQFPHLTELLIYPPLHMLMQGWFFRLVGYSSASADWYDAIACLLASLGWILAFRRLGLGAWSLAAAPLALAAFCFIGQRPELTGIPLAALGLAALLGPSRPERFIGRLLLVLAPLAAPSALGFAGLLLALFTLEEAWRRRSVLPLLDSALAGFIGLLTLGVMIGFRYGEFLHALTWHQSRLGEGNMADSSKMGRAAFALVTAGLVWWRSRRTGPTLLLLAIGLGMAASMFIHMRAGTEITMTGLSIILAVLCLVPQGRWRNAAALVLLAGQLILTGDLFFFWSLSKADAALDQKTRTAVESLRAEGRTVVVDEAAAKYLYDYQIADKISWTWLLEFPAWRPYKIEELQPGDVWVVSRYTIMGYLRGDYFLAPSLNLAALPYKTTPRILCWLGRSSCRLPARRFDYVLVWRDRDGKPMIQDMAADPAPRPLTP